MTKFTAEASSEKLYLHGEIDERMFSEFSKDLDGCTGPVLVELMSEGGSNYASLAIADKIRGYHSLVTIQVLGPCMSAAVLILASGDVRYISDNSWVMVHEDWGKISGSVTELEKQAVQMRKEELQWVNLMQELTGVDASHWGAMAETTTYLTPEDCLNLNLADAIRVTND